MNYCANSGTIKNTTYATAMQLGGIAGSVASYDYDGAEKESLYSSMSNCTNFGNINGKGRYFIGGTCAELLDYCKSLYNKNVNTTGVKWNGVTVTAGTGESSDSVTTEIGYIRSSNCTIKSVSSMNYRNNVYETINGLSDSESTIWSNSNVDKPTLLWETTIK